MRVCAKARALRTAKLVRVRYSAPARAWVLVKVHAPAVPRSHAPIRIAKHLIWCVRGTVPRTHVQILVPAPVTWYAVVRARGIVRRIGARIHARVLVVPIAVLHLAKVAIVKLARALTPVLVLSIWLVLIRARRIVRRVGARIHAQARVAPIAVLRLAKATTAKQVVVRRHTACLLRCESGED